MASPIRLSTGIKYYVSANLTNKEIVLTDGVLLSSKSPVIAPAYRALVLAEGAGGYWRLNEPSGLTATDLSSGGRNATLPGSHIALGVAGALRDGCTGLSTDGSQSAATLGSNVVVGTTCSFEWWFKPQSVAATYNGIIGATAGGNGVYYDGVNRLALVNTPGGDVKNTTPFTSGALYHVVVSINATTITYYVNGVADGGGASNWAGINVNGFLTLGAGGFTCDLLQELAVYPSVALSATQAAVHYLAGGV